MSNVYLNQLKNRDIDSTKALDLSDQKKAQYYKTEPFLRDQPLRASLEPKTNSIPGLGIAKEQARDPVPRISILSQSIFTILAYTAIALVVYAYASYTLSCEIAPLEERCHILDQRLKKQLRKKAELSNIVASLSDPAADEYALITELGRIPSESRLIVVNPSPQNTL